MISFLGLILSILFVLFFLWLFISTYNFAVKHESEKLFPSKKPYVMFSIIIFAGAWLVYWLLCKNSFIYSGDFGGYWVTSFIFMKSLFSKPLLAILKLGGGILFQDHNDLIPAIISLPLKLFGYTFTRYVIILYFLFLVPAFTLLIKILKYNIKKQSYIYLLTLTLLTFTPFYWAMLVGMPDVACLVPIALSLLILKDYDALSLNREQIKRDVYISAVLLSTILFRRYFVFYVIGYMVPLTLMSFYYAVINSDGRPKSILIRNVIINIAVIGIFALFIMLTFFGPMLFRILRTNYVVDYKSFDAPFTYKVLQIVSWYGYLTLILAAVGLILSLITKRMRKYSCFSAISIVVTALTFFKVQAMAHHHFYALTAQFFILSVIGIIQIAELFKNKFSRNLVLALYVIVTFCGFTNCYFPESRPSFKPVSALFSKVYNPLVNKNIPKYKELAAYLNELTEGTDKAIYIIVGGNLGSESIRHLYDPYKESPVPNLMKSMGGDLVNGFPPGYLQADFILASKKSCSNSQFTTGRLAVELMDNDGKIGRHFKKLERVFTFDNDDPVFIYEKQSDFTREDLEYLADIFTKAYPGREDMFADRILGKTGNIGDALAQRTDKRVIAVLRWLLDNKLFTPEDIAEITARPMQEIKMLMKQ